MQRLKQKPRGPGSFKEGSYTRQEVKEYYQTGMVRVKEAPAFSEDRKEWPYGCYRSINIKEILGGEELLSWDPDVELEIISRVYMTEYGIIGMEDTGKSYRLHVVDRNQRHSVLRDLEWNGCRARITAGGFITVLKEELICD